MQRCNLATLQLGNSATLQCLTRCWQGRRKAFHFIRSRRRNWLRVYRTIDLSADKLSTRACLCLSEHVCVCVCVLISGHAACHKSWVLNYSRKLDSAQADTATCHLPRAGKGRRGGSGTGKGWGGGRDSGRGWGGGRGCGSDRGAIASMSARLEAAACRQRSDRDQAASCCATAS